MKKDEKYAGKTDDELLVILREERDNAVRKIQVGFKNRSKKKRITRLRKLKHARVASPTLAREASQVVTGIRYERS